ncbi:histidine phosphatase family protein [Rhizobium sp. NPDC090279]|uniref:histidine phosphatase family protein n=1 Tax=Rhizobium sp. NPDC090279 TaxID=3364499 RepID=UPI003839FA9C
MTLPMETLPWLIDKDGLLRSDREPSLGRYGPCFSGALTASEEKTIMAGLLLLARQGQSEADARDLFVGNSDSRLTHLGREEARGIASQLRRSTTRVDLIVQQRSRQSEESVQIVRKELGVQVPVLIDAGFCERDLGDITRMNKELALQLYGADYVLRWRRSFDSAPPNGESLRDFRDRVWPPFQELVATEVYKGRNVLVISDSDFIRVLACEIEEIPPDKVETVEFERGQVIAYSFGGDGRTRNSTRSSHLRIVASVSQ